jgi:hypothetical protein
VTDVLVDYGVIVEVEPSRSFRIPADVVRCCVVPPSIKGAVMVRVEDLVVEPQTEARTAQSIGPDLGVLAVAAHLVIVPLRGQV